MATTEPKPTIDEIVVGDPPDAWAAAGFAVDDDGVCRIGSVRVRLVGRDRGKRILDWSLRDTVAGSLAEGLLDGIPTRPADAPLAEPATHPNGALSIDHVVLFTPDCARTTAALEAVGFTPLRVRDTSSYGAPMRQTFIRAGEVIIELIGPEEPPTDGSADGPAGFFGLALTVADLDATVGRLGPALGAPKDAVQPGRRIATLRHRDLGLSVAIALMSPEPGAVTTG
ncbi:MAG: VOC family protein [Acidimicrobiales bacterium]